MHVFQCLLIVILTVTATGTYDDIGKDWLTIWRFAGETALLPCIPRGHEPSYIWRKGKYLNTSFLIAHKLQNLPARIAMEKEHKYAVLQDGTLAVSDTSREDEGNYFCQISSEKSECEAGSGIYLSVTEPKEFSLSIDNCAHQGKCIVPAKMDGSLTVTCTASHVLPSTTLKWFNGSNEIGIDESTYTEEKADGTLIVSKQLEITHAWPSVLTCKTSDDSTPTKTVNVYTTNVQETHWPTLPLYAGRLAHLPCIARGENPAYFWRRGDFFSSGNLIAYKLQEFPAHVNNDMENKYTVLSDGTLIINNMSPEDEGAYFCRIVTPSSECYSGMQVYLKALTTDKKEDVLLTIDGCDPETNCTMFAEINSTFSLKCTADFVHTLATLKWFNGSEELTKNVSVSSKKMKNGMRRVSSSVMVTHTWPSLLSCKTAGPLTSTIAKHVFVRTKEVSAQKDVQSLLIIIFTSLGVIAILIFGGGTLCWCLLKNQGSSKSNHNTVTTSTDATTNSAAPVYGVVNKSTKKKSDNTDGNGVNAKLAASQPEPTEPAEYASVNKPKSQPQAAPRSSAPPEKMELQYADLDHGNRGQSNEMELQYADLDHGNRGQSNEVRQPTNEPTEYATVQSVIV